MLRLNRISIRYKTKSSKLWLERQSTDHHAKQAKVENYRSRAAYKLLEMDKKFKLFNRKSLNILDLGFAPGAWTQVAIERMKKLNTQSKILGVDLINCTPPKGSHFLQGDILSKRTHTEIREFFREDQDKPIDLILSDMMANTSGIKDNDHFASMELCDGAIILSCEFLKPGGSLIMKFYTGKEDVLLWSKMERMFERVYRSKPDACRGELREMYVLGIKRRGDVSIRDVFER